MDLSRLTKADRIILAAGLLLIIDLLFFPWHKIEVGSAVLGLQVKVTRSGVESPNAFWGILALLVAAVMVAQIAVSRFTSANLPTLPIPWSRVHLIAGVAVLALLLIKLVAETDFLGWGAYVALLCGAALAYGGFMKSKEPEGAGPRFMG